ncbi:hypothetical protein M3484_15415 [Pseudomonas sp. GX19020]|uniref:hypothetical protein n=1 Tax=Pseudomonas sp. GX19020 TaxID=2942277 RepID=UPI00201868B7|nr:hypothetical protein [Pseudomonas sp. GX19020]MCL4067962.1 hypothetical protein [Pseudomonas sp. GX19020]
MSRARAVAIIEKVRSRFLQALDEAARQLPRGLPAALVESVSAAALSRSRSLLTLGA